MEKLQQHPEAFVLEFHRISQKVLLLSAKHDFPTPNSLKLMNWESVFYCTSPYG